MPCSVCGRDLGKRIRGTEMSLANCYVLDFVFDGSRFAWFLLNTMGT